MPRRPPWTNFHLICTAVGVAHIITCDKLFGDPLRGVDTVGVENCPFPMTNSVVGESVGESRSRKSVRSESVAAETEALGDTECSMCCC